RPTPRRVVSVVFMHGTLPRRSHARHERGCPNAYIEAKLSVRDHGFSLHAATRAGAEDEAGREALLKYVLRPPIASERVQCGPDGLVRIALKKPFSDGTVAIDMDPLSLLCRLAAAVPPPRFHTVRYAGGLSSASKWRPLIVPKPASAKPASAGASDAPESRLSADEAPARDQNAASSRYRPWAELLRRTLGLKLALCPSCGGRMRLLALVTDPKSVARFMRHLGEPLEPPARAPAKDPPFWQSRVLRRRHERHAEQAAQLGLFEEH